VLAVELVVPTRPLTAVALEKVVVSPTSTSSVAHFAEAEELVAAWWMHLICTESKPAMSNGPAEAVAFVATVAEGVTTMDLLRVPRTID
jgi:hypothetical protein